MKCAPANDLRASSCPRNKMQKLFLLMIDVFSLVNFFNHTVLPWDSYAFILAPFASPHWLGLVVVVFFGTCFGVLFWCSVWIFLRVSRFHHHWLYIVESASYFILSGCVIYMHTHTYCVCINNNNTSHAYSSRHSVKARVRACGRCEHK